MGEDIRLREKSVGIGFLADFWEEKYFNEYIAYGGSKIKFVTGRVGSGKTHLLRLTDEIACENGYKTVFFSAHDVWLHDFKEIYVEILRQCDIMSVLAGCAREVIKGMGYDPDCIPEGQTFMDFLSSQNESNAITKREIRNQLKELFLDRPLMDNNFALACSLLTGGILGHPLLENANQELLLNWMYGDKTVKLSLLRSLGLSPTKITKLNARHMLRSLSETVRISGYKGIIIFVDDMDVLLNKSGLDLIHYTKLRREDAYESIRQLIDDIDSQKNMMFVFAMDRELIDDETKGIKSYQALWMRIQNEISGSRFNRFADIVDLDRLALQEYDESTIRMIASEIMKRNASVFSRGDVSKAFADEIINNMRNSSVGVFSAVEKAVLGGVENV